MYTEEDVAGSKQKPRHTHTRTHTRTTHPTTIVAKHAHTHIINHVDHVTFWVVGKLFHFHVVRARWSAADAADDDNGNDAADAHKPTIRSSLGAPAGCAVDVAVALREVKPGARHTCLCSLCVSV